MSSEENQCLIDMSSIPSTLHHFIEPPATIPSQDDQCYLPYRYLRSQLHGPNAVKDMARNMSRPQPHHDLCWGWTKAAHPLLHGTME